MNLVVLMILALMLNLMILVNLKNFFLVEKYESSLKYLILMNLVLRNFMILVILVNCVILVILRNMVNLVILGYHVILANLATLVF